MIAFSKRASRFTAGLIALSFAGSIYGCSPAPERTYAGNNPPYNAPAPPQRNGNGGVLGNMSTGKKLALLAGAAAVYYMWKKHQSAPGEGATGKYYRSKNGRVYYRDARGNAVWVTPPSGGIQVPADEVQRYESEARQNGFYNAYGNGGSMGGGNAGPAGPAGPGGYGGRY
jgi:hypothetical protein